tara:strand:- start:6694 stop:7848 length:1155 start_codon:yes stop_codon:yes gene_type:complete
LSAVLLNKDDFGELFYYLAVFSVISIFIKFGLTSLTQKIIIDSKEKESEIINAIFTFKLIFLVFGLFSSLILFYEKENYILMLMFIQLVSLSDFFVDYSFHKNTFIKFYKTQVIINSILIIIYLIAIYIQDIIIIDVFMLATIYVLPHIILVTSQILLIKKNQIHFSFIEFYNNFKVIYKAAFPYLIIGFLTVLIIRTDVFMLVYFLGYEVAGYYSVYSRIIELMYLIPALLVSGIKSFTLKAKNEEYLMFYKKSLKYFFFGSILLVIIFQLISPILISTIFDRSFLLYQIALNIIIFSFIPNSLNFLITSWYMRNSLQLELMAITLFVVIANVVLNLILIQTYGIYGASLASVISFFAGIFIFPILFSRTREIPKFIFNSLTS